MCTSMKSFKLTPFCMEKSSVRKWTFNVSATLYVRFWLELGIMQECSVAEHNISKCNSKCKKVCLQH